MNIQRNIFLVTILVLFVLRFTLLGHGLIYFVDEFRYFNSVDAIKLFSQYHFAEGFARISSTQGRPGDAVVRLFPAVIQAFLFVKFKLNTNSPISLIVPAFINWLVTWLNTYLFYKLCRKILTKDTAQMATVFYMCLINTNIYLRHVLPYDAAITFFLGATLAVWHERQRSKAEKKWLLIAGILAGCCYAVYPGYFVAVPMLAILVSKPNLSHSLRRLVVLGVGVTSVLFVFEAIAYTGGTSYLLSSKKLSGTINQGDYSAGFSFVPQYLVQVEGLLGIGLLLGLLWVCYRLISLSRRLAWQQLWLSPPHLIAVALLLGWFSYAVLVYFVHKLVFYGRIVHLFIPFLIIVVFYGLAELIRKRTELYIMVVYVSIILVSLGSFLSFYTTYKSLVYAEDIVFANDIYSSTKAKIIYTTTVGNKEIIPVGIFQAIRYPAHPDTRYFNGDSVILVNFGVPHPLNYIKSLPVIKNATLIAKAPVANGYLPYQFEVYNEFERKLLKQHKLEFGIYHISAN